MVTYHVIDNGGISFIVHVNKQTHDIQVFKTIFDNGRYIQGKSVLRIKYMKLWLGIGKTPKDKGNSIVFQVDADEYYYIGHKIGRFKLDEPIIKLASPIGNSNVPYPFIVTKNYYCLLLENVCIPKQSGGNDPYTIYYGMKQKQSQLKLQMKFKQV